LKKIIGEKFLMKKIWALAKKELRIYFNSPIAYIFLVAFLGLSSWIFFRTFFLAGQAQMRGFFEILPWIFLLLIPSLTMRIWSEEFRSGTIETLFTSSISIPAAVAGKILASFLFLIICLLLTFPLAISVGTLGNLDWGAVAAGYFGAFFLGASFIALGFFISAATKNQIVAFILSAFSCFLFLIIGSQFVIFSLPNFLGNFCRFISLGTHFDSMLRGVFDTRDLIFYFSFISLFLFLNIEILQIKKK